MYFFLHYNLVIFIKMLYYSCWNLVLFMFYLVYFFRISQNFTHFEHILNTFWTHVPQLNCFSVPEMNIFSVRKMLYFCFKMLYFCFKILYFSLKMLYWESDENLVLFHLNLVLIAKKGEVFGQTGAQTPIIQRYRWIIITSDRIG